MTYTGPAAPIFHEGDEVVLVEGTYQGTLGVFVRFRDDDVAWADIAERNGTIRSHPVAWLGRAIPQGQSSVFVAAADRETGIE